MPCAHDRFAFDEAVTDQRAVMRAHVIDHDELSGLEPGYGDWPARLPRSDDSVSDERAGSSWLIPAV